MDLRCHFGKVPFGPQRTNDMYMVKFYRELIKKHCIIFSLGGEKNKQIKGKRKEKRQKKKQKEKKRERERERERDIPYQFFKIKS